MRRVLLVNALIFAVLAAAVALAYYGYSYTSEVSASDRERAILQELADEKVSDIEARIETDDNKLLGSVTIEPMADLRERVKASGAAATSVFVLDDRLQLVPDGIVSSRPGKPGRVKGRTETTHKGEVIIAAVPRRP